MIDLTPLLECYYPLTATIQKGIKEVSSMHNIIVQVRGVIHQAAGAEIQISCCWGLGSFSVCSTCLSLTATECVNVFTLIR